MKVKKSSIVVKNQKTLNFHFHADYIYGWSILFMAGGFHNGLFVLQRILLEWNFSYVEIFLLTDVFTLIILITLLFTIYPQQLFGDTLETFGWKYSYNWMNACLNFPCYFSFLIANDMMGFGDSMAIYVCSGTIYLLLLFLLRQKTFFLGGGITSKTFYLNLPHN